MSPLPPLPPGFTLDAEPPTQGGGLPPLPSGFTLDAPVSRNVAPSRTTPESVRAELGPFNPLELLKKPGVGTTALRVVPQMAGYMLAGPTGGAVGAGAGEIAAEVVEGQGIRWPTVALESTLGAIPGGKTGATVLRNLGKRALQGGLFGVGGGAARIGLEEGRLPTASEATTQAVTGAALGGLLGGAESYLTRGRRIPTTTPTQEPPRPLLALPPARPLPVTPEGRVVVPPSTSGMPEDIGALGGMSPQQIAAAQQRLATKAKGRKKADISGITVTRGQYPQPELRPLVKPATPPVVAVKQPSGQKPLAEPPLSPEVSNRMALLRSEVDDARTNLPTGKIFGTTEGETGLIQKHAIGAGKSIREQLAPLYPELRELPDVGPKEIVTAIEKDRGNKLYLQIKDAVEQQMAKEVATPEARVQRPTDYDEFAKFVDEMVAQESGTRKQVPTGAQPPLLRTQAELPPTPLQAKTPQVEHGQLLEGFRPPEKPAPELPLKPSGTVKTAPVVYAGYQEGFGKVPGFHQYTLMETVSDKLVKGSTVSGQTLQQAGFEVPPPTTTPLGTVEFGMGLPIPEKVKEWLKRFGGRAPVVKAGLLPRPANEPAPPVMPPLSEGQRIRAERRTQVQPPLTPPGATIGAAPSPPLEVPPFQAAQQRLLDAIKAAKPIRAETERLYSLERGKRLGAALEVGQTIPGKEGYFAQLGKLSGELPKGKFEPMTLDAETVKTLFTGIRESRAISGFDQITAQRGLAKLLGEYGGVVPTKGELELLGRVFPPEFVEEVLKKRGLIPRLLDMTAEALAIPKSLMASLDLSASMRQGFTGITAFPRQWGRAFKDQFRYFGSERAYEAMIQEIESRPTFDKMRQAKLALSAVDGTTLTGREEQFMSTLPERIPGIGRLVRASDRAYTGFLTKFRADAFEEMLRRAKQAGVPETEKVLADSAKFVNTFTGRGSLGQFEAAGSALSTAFFSPRLMASRFQMLNPLYYTSLDPFVRKQALKAALGTVALGTTVLALAKAGGAKVGTDPRNADFGKVRVGNTRWDVWAGLSHYPRIASQLISSQVVSSVTGKTLTLGEGYKPLTRKDILQRFFENKANPAVGFALRMLEGRGFDGKPITVLKEVRDLFTPMILQDMYDLYNEDPTLLPWATPAVFGIGVQTYGPKRPR